MTRNLIRYDDSNESNDELFERMKNTCSDIIFIAIWVNWQMNQALIIIIIATLST